MSSHSVSAFLNFTSVMWPISDKLQQKLELKAFLQIALLVLANLISLTGLKAADPATDTTLVKDLLTEAYFFRDGSAYLPLIDKEDFDENTLHFKLQKDQLSSTFLRIGSVQHLAIFINDKLISGVEANKKAFLNADSLFGLYGDELHAIVYSRSLSALRLDFSAVIIESGQQEEFIDQQEVVVVSQRNKMSSLNNFALMGLIIIGAFAAVLYNYYPRVTADYFRLSRAMAFREIDENLLKSRPFTWINVLYYLFFAL
ncbi:hypothetical protein E1176_00520, partial [Fulvivirga sp. RKSG066]|uniref:hypothetical protein n=1 Tax=Fulvivirga aurantia TaxID=2529383 RepID=UPI0012BD7CE2